MMNSMGDESKTPGGRRPRSDGLANKELLLRTAAGVIRREGAGVPLATIAAEAGVGVGTLYRHYPSREALFTALTHRSYRLILDAVHEAVDTSGPTTDALRCFLDRTIAHGTQLVLPMHGGPALLDRDTLALRAAVRDALDGIVSQGQGEGTIRSDITSVDVIMFGAMIAQPLPHATNWKRIARRQAAIFLDGLTPPHKVSPRSHNID